MLNAFFSSNPTKLDLLDGYRDLLNVNDLSKIFGVSKNTIYKELKAGKFGEPKQIGREFKIPKIYILQKYFLSEK